MNVLHWEALAFIGWLAIQVVAYEAWAIKTGRPTISKAMRALTERVRWIAVLIVLLNCFFAAHCFGKSLGITD